MFRDMLHTHGYDHAHVVVVQGIDDLLAVPLALDKMRGLKILELVGDGGLCHIKTVCYILYA